MNVDEISNRVSLLGLGLSNPTLEDNDIALKYVNLAHLELSRKTLKYNTMLSMGYEQVSCSNGVLEELDYGKPFEVRSINIVGQKSTLPKVFYDKILSIDPELTSVGYPSCWYLFNNKMNIYPKYTGTFGVWYWLQPIKITINTLESDIPYPISYHPILVDGACYYLFQSETGFKDKIKMQEALIRWNLGKTELLSHMCDISGDDYSSTYSPV